MTRIVLIITVLMGIFVCLGLPGCAVYLGDGYYRDGYYDDGYYYGQSRYYRSYDRDDYRRYRDWDDRNERWGR